VTTVAIYRYALTPDAIVEVEDTGSVVIVTPERCITVTNIQDWIDQLALARMTAQVLDPPTTEENKP